MVSGPVYPTNSWDNTGSRTHRCVGPDIYFPIDSETTTIRFANNEICNAKDTCLIAKRGTKLMRADKIHDKIMIFAVAEVDIVSRD